MHPSRGYATLRPRRSTRGYKPEPLRGSRGGQACRMERATTAKEWIPPPQSRERRPRSFPLQLAARASGRAGTPAPPGPVPPVKRSSVPVERASVPARNCPQSPGPPGLGRSLLEPQAQSASPHAQARRAGVSLATDARCCASAKASPSGLASGRPEACPTRLALGWRIEEKIGARQAEFAHVYGGMSWGRPTRIKKRAKPCAKCSRYGL